MIANDDVVKVLNRLVVTSKDGEYGFNACARQTRSPHLRTLFLRRAHDCYLAAAELKMHVALLGGKPKTRSSIQGGLHRCWVWLRGSLLGYSEQSVLDECDRGERAALLRYRAALRATLPVAERLVVEYQFRGVLRNQDEIRALHLSKLRAPLRAPLSSLREPAV